MIAILADTSALVSLEIKHLVSLASKFLQFSITTDDVKALPYMKSCSRVKVLTSAFVIRLLYDLKKLSRHEAIESIKEISSSRDWYGGVLETIWHQFLLGHNDPSIKNSVPTHVLEDF